MQVKRLLVRNPVVTYTSLWLVIVSVRAITHAPYDGGFGGVLFGLGILLGLVPWAISELLFTTNAGRAFPMMEVLVIVLSFGAAALLDAAWRQWRRARSADARAPLE